MDFSEKSPSFNHEARLKNGVSIYLRVIERKDVPQIWENFNQVVSENKYLPIYTPVIDDWEKKQWFREITSHGNFCIVAEEISQPSGKRVVGQCTIENIPWEASDFVGQLGIIIRSDFRDLGVGYHLIESAKEMALKKGRKKIILSTLANNKLAINLYKKCGFGECGRYTKQFFVDDMYVDEMLMEVFLEKY